MPNSNTSIVIVTYFTGEILFECIDACLKYHGLRDTGSKNYGDFGGGLEIIIVDNGNDAVARGRLSILSNRDERIKYIINERNLGFGAACNIGASHAKFAKLIFLNPDAILTNNALNELSKVQDSQIMGGIITDKDGHEQRGARRNILTLLVALSAFFGKDNFNLNKTELPQTITEIGNISGALFAITHQTFEVLGGFDEGYFLHVEDIDLCKRMLLCGGKVLTNPHAVAIHIGGTSDAPKPIVEYYKFKGFARYFLKYENLFGKILFVLIAPFLFSAMMFRALIAQIKQKRKNN